MLGYCMQCKTMKEMIDITNNKSHSGKCFYQGICAICGSQIIKYVKENENINKKDFKYPKN